MSSLGAQGNNGVNFHQEQITLAFDPEMLAFTHANVTCKFKMGLRLHLQGDLWIGVEGSTQVLRVLSPPTVAESILILQPYVEVVEGTCLQFPL